MDASDNDARAWSLLDETVCIARLKELRWPSGPFCPYCGDRRIYNLNSTRLPFCGGCKSTFSVKVGTIFHGSPLPMAKWFTAIRLVTDPKGTVTVARMAAAIEVGQMTAWHVLFRLRHAAATPSFNRAITAGGRGVRRRLRSADPSHATGRTYVTKFRINLSFEEALERFANVERGELQESLALPSKKRMPAWPRPTSVPTGDRPTP
jgi:transposase-like protein